MHQRTVNVETQQGTVTVRVATEPLLLPQEGISRPGPTLLQRPVHPKLCDRAGVLRLIQQHTVKPSITFAEACDRFSLSDRAKLINAIAGEA